MSIRKSIRQNVTINLLSEEERDNKKAKEIPQQQEPIKEPLNNQPSDQVCKSDPEEPKKKRIRGPKDMMNIEQQSVIAPTIAPTLAPLLPNLPPTTEEEAPQIGVKIKKKENKRKQKLMEFGSFERGDRINKLEPYRISGDERERVFRVHWKERKDGTQPKASFADYEELKHQSPFKVIKWWESTWENARKIVKENENKEIQNQNRSEPPKQQTREQKNEQHKVSIIEQSKQIEQPKLNLLQNEIIELPEQTCSITQMIEQHLNPPKSGDVAQPIVVGQNKKLNSKPSAIKQKSVQIIELENEPIYQQPSEKVTKQTLNEVKTTEKPYESRDVQKEVAQQSGKDVERDLSLLEKEFLFIPDNPETQALNQNPNQEQMHQEVKESEKPQEQEKPNEKEKHKEIEKSTVVEQPKEKPKELEKSIIQEKLKDKLKELEKSKEQEKTKEKEKPKEKPKENEKGKTNEKHQEVIDLDSPQLQPSFQLHSNSILDDICEFADKIKSVKLTKPSEEESKQQQQEFLCAQVPQTQDWVALDSEQNDEQIDLNIEA